MVNENGKLGFFKKFVRNLQQIVISDAPNEVIACHFCNATECTEENWQKCSNRLAQNEFLESYGKNIKKLNAIDIIKYKN